MTKFFILENDNWLCLASVGSVISLAKIDTFEYSGVTYRVESVNYNIDHGILEVYLGKLGK